MRPILQGIAPRVKFSREERGEVKTKLIAARQRYGEVSAFVTFAYDDTNDINTMRICWPTSSNTLFPAVSSIAYDSGSKSLKEVSHSFCRVFLFVFIFTDYFMLDS